MSAHDSSDTGTTVPIQRYNLGHHPIMGIGLIPRDNGKFVEYADHVAAMDEQQDIRREEKQVSYMEGQEAERARWAAVTDEPDSHALGVYKAGISDERARIRQAVMHMPNPIDSMDLLPIIDGKGDLNASSPNA